MERVERVEAGLRERESEKNRGEEDGGKVTTLEVTCLMEEAVLMLMLMLVSDLLLFLAHFERRTEDHRNGIKQKLNIYYDILTFSSLHLN